MSQSYFVNYYTCPHCARHFQSRGTPLAASTCPMCQSFAMALLADELDNTSQVIAVRAGGMSPVDGCSSYLEIEISGGEGQK